MPVSSRRSWSKDALSTLVARRLIALTSPLQPGRAEGGSSLPNHDNTWLHFRTALPTPFRLAREGLYRIFVGSLSTGGSRCAGNSRPTLRPCARRKWIGLDGAGRCRKRWVRVGAMPIRNGRTVMFSTSRPLRRTHVFRPARFRANGNECRMRTMPANRVRRAIPWPLDACPM